MASQTTPPRDPDPSEVAGGYERIVERFVHWADTVADIRAAAIIGSRARTDHPADVWADLDIIILATDPNGLAHDPAWAARLGDVWIAFVEPTPGGDAVERRILFAGGLDVDFAFFPVEHVGDASFRDTARAVIVRGARVLVDKDGELGRLSAELAAGEATAPSSAVEEVPRAALPLPDAATVAQVAGDFWYHAVWTAKHLRRGELWWAKGGCDGHMKELLRVALEWDAASHGRDPWFRGRFLEEWADPGAVTRLREAFAPYDEREVWRALGVTMDLFGDVVQRACRRLGVPYPDDVEAHARGLVGWYAAGHRPG